MKLVTSHQMQALDKAAIEKCNIASPGLMERAGKGASDIIIKRFPKKGTAGIVVGKGNNGGDGLVIARLLKEAGFNVNVYLTAPWSEFSPDARVNWEKLAGTGVVVKEEFRTLTNADLIIDAVFGTGLSNDVTGKYKAVIEAINAAKKPVVSIDIPSGLSADTGMPLGVAVKARLTVTFAMMKVGLVAGLSHEYTHEVEMVDIGIPKELTDDLKTGYYLITPDIFEGYFGKRLADSHKGDFGHVLVVGGASGKIGAGLLSGRAALRSGAGLVTYALPGAAYIKFDTRAPEVMCEGVEDKGRGIFIKDSLPQIRTLLGKADVMAIGPGIGIDKATVSAVLEIVKKSQVPVVIDADGLNAVASDLSVLSGRKNHLVLTPHPGEMIRLLGREPKISAQERIELARNFAKVHKVYLVLKGHRTVIGTPEGDIYINETGNAGMATAGSGDVLTGVIAGFMAQKMPVDIAVVAGVYLHGLAGDMAAKNVGERGLIASDIISELPKAIKFISSPL
ncbi:MAG: bifunctional ADP-dependent NAD(P)H-hydrate dehydratase/NAD(P)H-hydrate epimerase [Deltaproteobacteria bacterium CG11_big_fil_rev_8_21_14_0_20_49_13]|nr:MAG: bifunctional ADP-dependent NAD(P)H-hydrate dehydratase/NAD(P)H-hydrate epimerase [Deltaproteobacteria bacterium CG11_big_fil_rev_8_21_14_0_20_49_13]